MKHFKLSRSFRCPSPVLFASGQVLQRRQFLEGCPSGVKIEIREFETGRSEADWIAARIENMVGGVRSYSMESGMADGTAAEEGTGFSDFAVLCRSSFMFEPFIEAFGNHGIACQIAGSVPFYREEPCKTILRLFRDAFHGRDTLLDDEKTGGLDVLLLRDIFTRGIAKREPAAGLLESAMDAAAVPGEITSRMSRCAGRFSSDYAGFFRALVTGREGDDLEQDVEAVSLMTLHASKGLEFSHVFIPGCEEKILPFELFGEKPPDEIAEEERLFYVGATRTRKSLWLTCARKRAYRARVIPQKRSRFLGRIEEGLVNLEKRESRKTDESRDQLSLFS